MALADWQTRLAEHFQALHGDRGDEGSVFALEHGLDDAERLALTADVQRDVEDGPSTGYPLPWVVHAAEVGYVFDGDEYWPIFEKHTPGWSLYGQREWLRARFVAFARSYGGAQPAGPWAGQFRNICWPITHAILPRDLQRRLAQVLYDLRYFFSGDLFRSPEDLGRLIASRSASTSKRFQQFVQRERLVGQIAAALLLAGSDRDDGLILAQTLNRLTADIGRTSAGRAWLRDARDYAHRSTRVRGLAPVHVPAPLRRPGVGGDPDQVGAEALGIEPRLILRPLDAEGLSYEVITEIPNLYQVPVRFPATRDTFTNSRFSVAGSSGRKRPALDLLDGRQSTVLKRWPRPGEVLLAFEDPLPELTALLTTECHLRPGPVWLFRITTDRSAYEVRSRNVRPGQRYVLVGNLASLPRLSWARSVTLSCEGVTALRLDVPAALSPEDAAWLTSLGVPPSKTLTVWPAGIGAAAWDGDGQAEWLATETPIVALRADHALASLAITLTGAVAGRLDVGDVSPGETVFVELPGLGAGRHHVSVLARGVADGGREVRGELDVVMRAPEAASASARPRAPLIVDVTPPAPSLQELWEGRVALNIRGPAHRAVVCTLALVSAGEASVSVQKLIPTLELPVSAATWRTHFEAHFREARDVQNAYDEAAACTVTIVADDIGRFQLVCERELTPLRWAVRRSRDSVVLRLIDDSGSERTPEVRTATFAAPADDAPVTQTASASLDVSTEGGLFVARSGTSVASIIVPPRSRDWRELNVTPRIATRTQTPLLAAPWILDRIEQWGCARITGGLLALAQKRKVVLALTQHLFGILGGEAWARAEQAPRSTENDIEELKRRVAREGGLAAGLKLEVAKLAAASCQERAARFAESVGRYRLVSPDSRPPTPVRSDAGLTVRRAETNEQGSVRWLSEFTLRLASDPVGVRQWAGHAFEVGLERLAASPVLARSARFLVIIVELHSASQSLDATALHAGWEW